MIARHAKILFFVLLMALVPVTLKAQQQPANEDNADDRKTGSLNGRVVNESGQPVPNAAIFVRALNGSQMRATTTSTEGVFTLNGLDPTIYSITASMPTYVMRRDPDAPFAFYRPGDSVKLDLIKGGVITGTVTSVTGEPLIGIPVRAYMIRDAEGRKPNLFSFSGERTTDDRGIYRIYGLTAGTYLVASAGLGYGFSSGAYEADVPTFAPSSTRDTATEITVRPGEETTNVDIRHRGELGHDVSGVASGSISPGQYSPFNISLTPVSSGLPAANSFQMPGSRGFSFTGVPDGTYDVVAQSSSSTGTSLSDPVRIVVKGADVTGLELVTKPLGSISGRLVLAPSKETECKGKKTPLLSESLITPLRKENKTPNEQQTLFMRFMSPPTVPDSEGAFTFRSMSANQYGFNVKLFARYWYLQSILLPSAGAQGAGGKPGTANQVIDIARQWLKLKQGERVSGLTITVAGGAASLRGNLDSEGGEKTPPKLYLNLVPAEREKSDDVLRFFTAPINEDGSFALGNLPPGRYWSVLRTDVENEAQWLTKLRSPQEAELRAKLRRDAEAMKTEIELKPCQSLEGYKLPWKSQPAP